MMEAQPQQYAESMPLNAPYAQAFENVPGIVLELTDPDDEVQKFRYSLMGYRVTPDGKVVPCGKPLCNQEGVEHFTNIVQSIASTITTLSALDGNEIKRIAMGVNDLIHSELGLGTICLKYNIEKNERDALAYRIISMVFIVANRAHIERINDKRLVKGGFTEQNVRMDNSQKSPGMFGRLFGGGK